MKKMFVLSTLIISALICSCEKEVSTVEAQLAKRKVELDSREQALDEREKAVEQREKLVAEKEKAVATSHVIQSRQQHRDSAELEAEREKRLQQLPPELRALIPDRSQLNPANIAKDRDAALQRPTPDPAQAQAERERRIQQLPPEFQALIRDRSLLDPRSAGKNNGTEDRAAQLQRSLEDARRKQMNEMAAPTAESSDTQPGAASPSPTP